MLLLLLPLLLLLNLTNIYANKSANSFGLATVELCCSWATCVAKSLRVSLAGVVQGVRSGGVGGYNYR